MQDARAGVLAMILACTIWGLSPLYYKLLATVPPLEVLSHRTLWSAGFFMIVLLVQGRFGRLVAALSGLRAAAVLGFAALMISTNWFLFIMSVQIGRTTEASLGYYIFPLVAVLLGVVAFGERLGRGQAVAVALAVIAVLVLSVGLGAAPWISLVLAATFGLYGLIKKRLTVGPVVSVTAEVMLLSPLAAGWLVWLHFTPGGGAFGEDAVISLLLALSGPLTAVPLILFAYASQRVTMASIGLLQYINPTLQFVCAVMIFGEPFGLVHAIAFGLIWTALALYSGAAWRHQSVRRRASIIASAVGSLPTNPAIEASAKP
ncbi:EamA family transporter RarD [Puniceibacterium sp. IMCC21224]|uniref:EamA family transporter RarD n=1 Tax=Puniceibacterium sp. IMCC21224 TaxID=1618204 RepID=UPI00064DB584|nr:EamA family transporter RarD [Puniceibacterium sp. IMCC21224]KMK67944.1 rarD protein [Puniceibacterium sp. IMCC21224]